MIRGRIIRQRRLLFEKQRTAMIDRRLEQKPTFISFVVATPCTCKLTGTCKATRSASYLHLDRLKTASLSNDVSALSIEFLLFYHALACCAGNRCLHGPLSNQVVNPIRWDPNKARECVTVHQPMVACALVFMYSNAASDSARSCVGVFRRADAIKSLRS